MTKQLNTGEAVAFMNAHGSCLSVKAIKSVDGVLGFDDPLYSQDYVNQLLGEIAGLKRQCAQYEELIAGWGETYDAKKHGVEDEQ